MRIVLTADEFGLSDDTVRATIECFERGALSSAAIMPAMPATAAATEFARCHPQFSFGAHLTFVAETSEHPLTDPHAVRALVTDKGLFPPHDTVRLRAVFRRLPVDQIVVEAEAQLGYLRDQGIELSYVSMHGQLHRFASFRAALRRVLPRFGIFRVRNVQTIYIKRPRKSAGYWLRPWSRRRLMRSFQSTDYFYTPASSFAGDWQQQLLRQLARNGAGNIEVAVHPGYIDFWRSDQRMGIQRFAEAARSHGHQVVGWKDI